MRAVIFLAVVALAATAAFAAQDPAEAKRFYEKVVAGQPDNVNAQFDLGNIYLAEKRYDEALEHYKIVGSIGLSASRMDDYYFNVAACYAGLGSAEEAIKSLEECIKVNPDYREAKELLVLYKNKTLSP